VATKELLSPHLWQMFLLFITLDKAVLENEKIQLKIREIKFSNFESREGKCEFLVMEEIVQKKVFIEDKKLIKD